MIGYIGFAQEADKSFEKEYSLEKTPNGLRACYDEIVQRISTEVDVSECGDLTTAYRIKRAVWDTGATTSIISTELAEKVGFRPIETGLIVTATGKAEVPMYILDIHLTRDLILKSVKVFGSPMKNRDVEFLIGMDVISKGRLTVDSTSGKTIVVFETV